MELEWHGIPSVAIVHEGVEPGVRTMARLSGMDDYRYVVVPYPHALHPGWGDDELAGIVAAIAPEVLSLLTRSATGITGGAPPPRA
jgi:hypothetical protein